MTAGVVVAAIVVNLAVEPPGDPRPPALALYKQLEDIVWSLNERMRAWPDRGDEPTVKDAEMAEQARLKIA